MEYPDNNKTGGPSKHFLIRGGIAIVLVGGALLVQTAWFKELFIKKSSEQAGEKTTVGAVIEKDTNGNGIPDWEERLWGLDPTVLTTNGIANKTIIEQKRSQLSPESLPGNQPLNDTDKIARDLFTFSTALGQEQGVSSGNLSALAAKLATQGPEKNTAPTYTIKNITTVATTQKSLTAYKTKLAGTLATYDATLPEIELFIQSVESNDYSQLGDLDATISAYKTLSKSMAAIPVPIGVTDAHLVLINGIAGIARGLEKMQLAEEDGVSALVGLAEYRYFDASMSAAAETLTAYLQQYGIL